MVGRMSEQGSIAGYPLVRALRSDAGREVWVGADASGAGVEVHRARAGGDATLAWEAEAVLRCGHPQLVPVLDVATDGGAVLVRPLLPNHLADWLVQRAGPEPGEAVTVLAPVAQALGSLHDGGAAVGGFVAADVRIDADGMPLLLATGAAVETDRVTEAWRTASSRVAADVASWRLLAEATLEACGAALPPSAEAALQEARLAEAGEALLETWAALPLQLGVAGSAAAGADGLRGLQAGRRGLARRPRERAAGLDALWARIALLAERLPIARAVELRGRLGDARPALRRVRPRFWVVAGAGAVALVTAAVLLGQSAPASTSAVDATPLPTTPADTRAPTSPAAGPAPASPGDAPTPTGAPVSNAAPADDGAAAGERTAPEDVLVAATALLAEREACLDAGDAACLVALHESSSPLLVAAEPWRMPQDGSLELVQRLGDAWLLRVVSEREPASVLLMSTEAGWSVRDAWSDQTSN